MECGVCWRSRVCPADAIQPGNLTWPRVLREEFSNPLGEHKSTGVAGRGTEETKVQNPPSEDELSLITMCGHGLIASNRVRHLVKRIQAGAISPKDAAKDIARPCVCDIVNQERAEEVFQKLGGDAASVNRV